VDASFLATLQKGNERAKEATKEAPKETVIMLHV
jgi:hypothetical protein